MDINIRLARPDERDALEALQWRASLAWEEYREPLLANPDAIHLPAEQIAEGTVLVAETDRPVGFASWFPDEAGEAALDSLFVDPPHWGKGIGRRLLLEAMDAASLAGHNRMSVIANPLALGFYAACGFAEAGMLETRFGPSPIVVRSIG